MVALLIILTGFLYVIKVAEWFIVPLFITFLVLKVLSVISWSWWLVCLPLIAIPVLIILQYLFVALMHLVAENM